MKKRKRKKMIPKKIIERKLALVVVSPDFSSKSDPHVKLTYGPSPFVWAVSICMHL